MRSAKVFRAILGLSLGVTLFASIAQAQTEDKRTYFTFSAPIALPGATLPAGKYEFRIVDTTTSRKVIQVLSDDGKKPYVMANTIPDQRRDPAKDATVSFYETAAGTPAAVKSWWYPGESTGYQFIYPRAQARQIAQRTGKAVLTTRSASTKTEETKSAELTRVESTGKDVDVDAAANESTTVFNRSTPQLESQNAQVASQEGVDRRPPQADRDRGNAASSNEPAQQVARNELPKTASSLPIVGFIGMLSALGFVTLRFGTSLRS
jgi:hypothetical protein